MAHDLRAHALFDLGDGNPPKVACGREDASWKVDVRMFERLRADRCMACVRAVRRLTPVERRRLLEALRKVSE